MTLDLHFSINIFDKCQCLHSELLMKLLDVCFSHTVCWRQQINLIHEYITKSSLQNFHSTILNNCFDNSCIASFVMRLVILPLSQANYILAQTSSELAFLYTILATLKWALRPSIGHWIIYILGYITSIQFAQAVHVPFSANVTVCVWSFMSTFCWGFRWTDQHKHLGG